MAPNAGLRISGSPKHETPINPLSALTARVTDMLGLQAVRFRAQNVPVALFTYTSWGYSSQFPGKGQNCMQKETQVETQEDGRQALTACFQKVQKTNAEPERALWMSGL